MVKNKLLPYIQGTLVKTRDGKLQMLKITTAETTPGKQLPTGKAYSEVFQKKLEQFGRIDCLNMIIDSRGGSFYSAAGCQDAIRKLQKAGKIGKIRILIDGRCSSAATLVAFSNYENCEVNITPSSGIYIHMPKVYQYTKTGGIWSVIQKMGTKTVIKTLVEMYRNKTHVPKRVIREWMEKGKFFNAGEAVNIGFCDCILTRTEFEKGGVWNC